MRGFLLLIGLCTLLPACSGEAADEKAFQAGQLELSGLWARPSLPPHENAAAYLTIRNRGELDDALIGVSVDGAEVAEMHEMEMIEEGGEQRMRMRKVERLGIPAGGELVLKPGAEHLMFFELSGPWEEGAQLKLELTFDESPAVILTLPVQAAR